MGVGVFNFSCCICLNAMAHYPRTFPIRSHGGIYILKNEVMVSKLKSLMISLMALQAELRGEEHKHLSDAIQNIRNAMEKLK